MTGGLMVLLSVLSVPVQASEVDRRCEQIIGSMLVVEGQVDVKPMATNTWLPVAAEDPLCAGDIVRALANSSASLLLDAEQTIVRLKQKGSFALPKPQADGFWIELFEGTLNFLSRTPRALGVRTPFVNATVEGTEFQVQVDTGQAETLVSVLDGKVRVANELGALSLQAGQVAQASKGQPPKLRLDIRPQDAVQWSLYFPVLFEPGTDTATTSASILAADWYQRSLSLIRQGQLESAAASLDQAPKAKLADALALKAVIRLKQNRRSLARKDAQQALASDGESTAARLALSYVEQADYNLDAAVEQIEALLAANPEDALAITRLVELELSRGNVRAARQLVSTYQQPFERVARFRTSAGFVALLEGDVNRAGEEFVAAAKLAQSDPLNHLGQGLAAIRQGQLIAGRASLETAVSLEPGNALLRSYLAKAYFAEQRTEAAAEQLALASRLDPLDPTPWLYQAVMFQAQGQPFDALASLNRATALNDNRAVYRSKLLLDQDSAIKSVNRARIYRDLGLEQQALHAAVDSLVQDPTNAGAHQFLSETYASQEDVDIARVSELLQSQLLTGRFTRPVLPSAGESDLLVNDITASAVAGLNEYTSLFEQDGVMASLSASAGDFDTNSQEVAVAYQGSGGYLSAGYYHYETDELVPDQPIDYDIVNLLGKWFVTPELSLLAEYRQKDTERGDVAQRFEYGAAFSAYDVDADDEQAVLGFHYQVSERHDLLGLVAWLDNSSFEQITTLPQPLNPFSDAFIDSVFDEDSETKSAELQSLVRLDQMSIRLGFVATEFDVKNNLSSQLFIIPAAPFPIPPIPGPVINETIDLSQDSKSIYAYVDYQPSKQMTLSVGLDYDDVDGDDFSTDKLNPKMAVVIKPTAAWRLRGLASRSVKRPLITGTTLAPTQLAGFSLINDDVNGTEVNLLAFGADYQADEFADIGFEYRRRDFDAPLYGSGGDVEAREHRLMRLYASRVISPAWSVGIAFVREKLDREAILGVSDFSQPTAIVNYKLPFRLNYRPTHKFQLELLSTWVDHQARFAGAAATAGGKDNFNVTDVRLAYRAAKHFQLQLGVLNAFDERFNYQNTDFDYTEEKAPEFAEERTVYASVSVPF